jgi:CBS domain-containing protein
MLAEELMEDTIFSVRPDATLEDAAQRMLECQVNALPVLDDDGSVVGVIGIKDVLRAPARSGDGSRLTRYQRLETRGLALPSTLVKTVMARQVVTVGRTADVADVAATMVNRGVHPVIVVDSGRVVGLIGRADVVRVLLDYARAGEDRRPDEPIAAVQD